MTEERKNELGAELKAHAGTFNPKEAVAFIKKTAKNKEELIWVTRQTTVGIKNAGQKHPDRWLAEGMEEDHKNWVLVLLLRAAQIAAEASYWSDLYEKEEDEEKIILLVAIETDFILEMTKDDT